MESEGEYLEQRVERAPGLLREHLGQQLVEESLDAEGLHLRVDQQPAVRLHDARTQGRGCLVLHLDTRKMLFNLQESNSNRRSLSTLCAPKNHNVHNAIAKVNLLSPQIHHYDPGNYIQWSESIYIHLNVCYQFNSISQ